MVVHGSYPLAEPRVEREAQAVAVPWLIAREGIRLFGIAVGAETTLLQKLSDPHDQ